MKVRYGGLSLAVLSLTALGFLAVPINARAQDQTDQTAPSGAIPKTPVTLNVESADLYYTLKLLFQQIHADFTLDTSLRGTPVTVKLTNVPFDIALNAVLKASGQPLTYTYENGIFSIIPQRAIEEQPAPGTETPTPTPETKPILEKIYLSTTSVTDLGAAMGFAVIRTSNSFGIGTGGLGGGFGGGFGGGGMGMGGFGGGMGGFGGGMGGFGGGMGGFGGGMGGFGGGGLGGFGGGGFGGGRGY